MKDDKLIADVAHCAASRAADRQTNPVTDICLTIKVAYTHWQIMPPLPVTFSGQYEHIFELCMLL